ncbi:MAG: hypothetical protein ACYDEB_09060 [Dehalococcoidia bacterium]
MSRPNASARRRRRRLRFAIAARYHARVDLDALEERAARGPLSDAGPDAVKLR